MKKFFLLFFIGITAVFAVNSQNLQLADSSGPIANNAVLYKFGTPSSLEIVSHVFVKNTTGSAISVLVKKVELFTVSGTANAICWGFCYTPDVFIATLPIEIGAGMTDSLNFSGHYYPQEVPGVSTIRYVFFDERNPSDSVCVNVTYSTYPQAVPDHSSFIDLTAYPNPADQSVNFNIPSSAGTMSGIVIRNLLGEVVMDVDAGNYSGKLTLNTAGLAGGVYFYTLMENGRQVSTRKLVIRH